MLQMGDSPREIEDIARFFLLAWNMETIWCADADAREPRQQNITWNAPILFH